MTSEPRFRPCEGCGAWLDLSREGLPMVAELRNGQQLVLWLCGWCYAAAAAEADRLGVPSRLIVVWTELEGEAS